MATDEAVEPHDDAFCQTELADCFGGVARTGRGIVACGTGKRADIVLVEADEKILRNMFRWRNFSHCVTRHGAGTRDTPRFFGSYSDGECEEENGSPQHGLTSNALRTGNAKTVFTNSSSSTHGINFGTK